MLGVLCRRSGPVAPSMFPSWVSAYVDAKTCASLGTAKLWCMTETRSWIPRPVCCWCSRDFQKEIIDDRRVWVCPTKKCRERQDRYAMRVAGKLVNLPLPRQVELREAIDARLYTRIYIGGALGGAKSHGLRYLAYALCREYKHFSVLLLRRTIKELEKHHILEVEHEQVEVGGSYVAGKQRLDFDEGSSVQFGHCQHPESVSIWLSTSWDLILFDELPTFEEMQFVKIASRTGREEREDRWPGMVVAAGNPGGAWIEDFFLRKQRDPVEFPDYDPTTYHFIPSMLEDNPYIQAGYVKFLADLPKDQRDAWRWGSWDRFVGQFFKEWDEERHVARIEPLPVGSLIIGAMRWGYAKPGIFLWAAVLPDGRLHVVAQYPFAQTVPAKVAENILRITQDRGWTLHGAWGHREMGDDGEGGEDVFLSLQAAGLFVLPSRHELVNGWQRCRDWLQTEIGGRPALTIEPACDQLVRMLPRLVEDKKNPEEIEPSPGRDQSAHALRYLVMSRPRPKLAPGKPPYPENSAGKLFQDAVAELGYNRR